MQNTRTTARLVGALMLAVFLLYGVGSSIAIASTGALLAVGVTLMLLNSIAVIIVGALMAPVLRPRSPRVAVTYLATRIFEGVLLAVGAVSLLIGVVGINFVAYNVAMAGLGIGSLFLCVALYRSGLVPRFLAVWGFIGYASFATGCLLELGGVAGAGIVTTIPGGLFEIMFAIWLLVRGFGPARTPILAGAST